MRMSQNCRSPRADVVQIFVSIHVPYPRAFRPVDEEWLSSDSAKGAHRRIDSARNIFQSVGKKLVGFSSRNHGGNSREARVEGRVENERLGTRTPGCETEFFIVQFSCLFLLP